MKYVIAEHPITGYFTVSVFGEDVVHRFVALAMKKSSPDINIISAGFVYLDREKKEWFVSAQRSESLDLGPGKDDSVILNAFLVHGLTGIDLANWLAYLMHHPSLKPRGTGG